MTMSLASIQYSEDMVGQGHATKADTLNRLVVGVNNFRLVKSGANLTLEPVNGNLVDINGTIYAITTLPTLAPTSLGADTTYYVYLYNNAGTATLEASATVSAWDSKGRAIKNGAATHRLMGLARTITGPAWTDTVAQRYVASFDNPLPRVGYVKFTANRSLTNQLTLAEIHSELRLGAVLTGRETLTANVSGAWISDAAGELAYMGIGLNGSAPGAGACVGGTMPANACYMGFLVGRDFAIADVTAGFHYLGFYGATGGNYDVTWRGDGSLIDCTLRMLIVPNGGV